MDAIKQLPEGVYGQPTQKNFPTIDGLMKPNLLFQMTTASTHGVNIDALIDVVRALDVDDDDPVRFYFVVPPEQFPVFRPGTFESTFKTPMSSIPSNVEYWALELYPLNEEGRRMATSPPQLPMAGGSTKRRRLSASSEPHPDASASPRPCACKCKKCDTTECICFQRGQACGSDCHPGQTGTSSRPFDCKNRSNKRSRPSV